MRVSICIPAYNREKWIGSAIDSALAQTWPDKEVIVVDDGSSDRTRQICEQYGNRIIFARQDHLGGGAARNHLLRLASGDWIQYLDSDDYLLPTKVMAQLESAACVTELPEAIFGPFLWESWENDTVVSRRRIHLSDPGSFIKTWLRLEHLQIGAFLIRREPLIVLGGWNESLPVAEDHELWQRMLLSGWRFQFVDEPLIVWRQWSREAWGNRMAEQAIYCVADQLSIFRSQLVERGQWSHELQLIEEETRFKLARRLAKTVGPARGEAWYLQQMRLPYAKRRFATGSRKIRFVYQLLGFRNATRLFHAARVVRRSRYFQYLSHRREVAGESNSANKQAEDCQQLLTSR
jgi:glycosyltransferase involved in cell wall biosynthesis